jgi:hypothetical protein
LAAEGGVSIAAAGVTVWGGRSDREGQAPGDRRQTGGPEGRETGDRRDRRGPGGFGIDALFAPRVLVADLDQGARRPAGEDAPGDSILGRRGDAEPAQGFGDRGAHGGVVMVDQRGTQRVAGCGFEAERRLDLGGAARRGEGAQLFAGVELEAHQAQHDPLDRRRVQITPTHARLQQHEGGIDECACAQGSLASFGDEMRAQRKAQKRRAEVRGEVFGNAPPEDQGGAPAVQIRSSAMTALPCDARCNGRCHRRCRICPGVADGPTLG